MALSTSSPSARIRLNRITKFRVKPSASSTRKLNSIDNGTAAATNRALRSPITISSTRATKMNPVRMLFSRSVTSCCTRSD